MPGFKFLFCSVLVLGAILAPAMPGAAADFRLRRTPQSAATPAEAPQPGHVTYIRRLIRDANAAASRGDTEGARRLAERAHKIAVMYQSAQGGSPDCTPEATAELAQKFGSSIGSSTKLSSAEPKAAPPAPRVATSHAQELDILSMADPKFKGQPQSSSRTSKATEPSRTAENRLVNSKPATLSNKLDSSDQKPRQRVQASPAKVSRPAPAATSTTSESSRPKIRSHEPQRTAGRNGDTGRSSRPVAKSSARPLRSSARPAPAPIADPEVQSAIGSGDSHEWPVELNTEDAEVFPSEQPEALPPPAPPAEEISRTRSIRSTPDSPIGVWSPGDKAASGAAAPHRAVSLPNFLASEISPASRDVDPASRDRGPQLIETDFRRPTRSELPRLESHETVTHRPATLSGPAIRVREEPAVRWSDAAERPSVAKVSKAEALPIGLTWPSGTAERLVLAMGVALLLGGLVLFGLSFRRV